MDYSQYPTTLGEARADDDASKWTPRDALISVLRDIDSGSLSPDAAMVVLRERDGDGATRTYFRQSAPCVHTALGMLEVVKFKIFEAG